MQSSYTGTARIAVELSSYTSSGQQFLQCSTKLNYSPTLILAVWPCSTTSRELQFRSKGAFKTRPYNINCSSDDQCRSK